MKLSVIKWLLLIYKFISISSYYETENAHKYVQIHKAKTIFGIKANGICDTSTTESKLRYYYDDNLDNSLTFENGITFGCKVLSTDSSQYQNIGIYKLLSYMKNENVRLSIMGNPNENIYNFIPQDSDESRIYNMFEPSNSILSSNIEILNFLYAECYSCS